MFELAVTLEGEDQLQLSSSVYEPTSSFFKVSAPDRFDVDDEKKKFTKRWIEKYARNCEYSVGLYWGEWGEINLIYKKDGALSFSIESFWNTVQKVMDFLQPHPWMVATLGSIHKSWYGREINYAGPGFAYRHGPLGWGCAFKGEGHKRVVSRRYLEYGPWHVIRDEVNDITLIQFHDINADAETALDQAKLGHQLMGHPFEGGFIQRDYQISNNLSAIYSPAEKMLRYTINTIKQRPITRSELLDVCATRQCQLLGDTQPVERVGYMFIYEEEARQCLHELWLREIECWAFIDGLPVRLDEDYTPPPPQKPEWVQRLEAQALLN
jgi:hypothetical protein